MSKIKNILMFLGLGGAMIAGYVFFFGDSSEEAPVVIDEGTSLAEDGSISGEVPAVVQDFLPVLLNVKNIKLDSLIFKDKAFLTLRDSSIILVPDGTEGRPNPFAPIGFENFAQSSLVNTSLQAPLAEPTVPASTPPKTQTTPPKTGTIPKTN